MGDGENMHKYLRGIFKRILQILIITFLTIFIDYLTVILSHDDSIWLGESIETVGSIMFGPLVGFVSTLISSITTDYLTYHTFEYSFVGLFEAFSVALIGIIYRHLSKDEDKFGVKEIVVFNFVQILVNTVVLYLATPPAAVLFFGFIIEEWPRDELEIEMRALGDNAFSACISVALIGTVMMALFTAIRKQIKEHGNISAAFKSILKMNYIKKEYRTRAFEYSIGFVFAVALTMVDGVISGHVLGTDALAATSLMFPLVAFSSFVSNIITSGCSNLCAIAKGDGDYEKARRLFSLGLFATIILGLLQSVLFFLAQDWYFEYFNSTEAIGAFAKDYYRFYVLVPPCMGLTVFMDEIVSSDGDDMLSYAGYLSSFAVNVGASIVLSKVMGMSGLALGTMLSYVCYMAVVSIHFFKKSNTYRLRFWFSLRDLLLFSKHSLKTNTTGLCKSVVSTAFTKATLLFWGSEYLIANTVLCAMLEIYEMIKGPSEAAEYLFATYSGEKNSEGMKILFKEALTFCVMCGAVFSLLLFFLPNIVLLLYGIDDSPLKNELIKCIRYCSVGVIAAAVGGFLSDYYGDTEKPLWSCMMVIFRTALFPILFCVSLGFDGGIVAMGIGMLLSQIFAIAIFYGFVLIVKGSENIPYILDDPDFEKVKMNSFEYTTTEYERILDWMNEKLKDQGIDERNIAEAQNIALAVIKETGEKSGKSTVLGECVLRFTGDPEIIIKDNGELFEPAVESELLAHNVLMSCNSNTIHVGKSL